MWLCRCVCVCVCACSRRKMAALIRVDISGHTTAAPLEIATTLHSHTLAHTHMEKRGERALCGLCDNCSGQRSSVNSPRPEKWAEVGGKGKGRGERDNGRRFFFLARLRLVVDSLTAGASPFLHHHSFCRTVCHTIFTHSPDIPYFPRSLVLNDATCGDTQKPDPTLYNGLAPFGWKSTSR